MRKITPLLLAMAFALTWAARAAEPGVSINVDAGRALHAVSPLLYGIFFEDINSGADGGLYPERVKNGAFEFTDSMMGWKTIEVQRGRGFFMVADDEPLNSATPRYLSLYAAAAGVGIENEGFNGMGFAAGEPLTFSVYARSRDLKQLTIELISSDGKMIGTATLEGFTPEWRRHAVRITPTQTDAKGRLRITAGGKGTIQLDLISLLPVKTFDGHGLRADLAQLLKDLHPAFMRFPGGCIVEGHTLANRYQWKDTVGPLAERKLIVNRWNDEFKHRPSPDYYQSFGLGFFEYFQLCEDIGAEPLPILNCGMACQFNSSELVPVGGLEPYIQDALDLIEFANGPAASKWGKVRAAMGHPKPFNMKLLGVGNEQWGSQYIERYEPFARAIKARYPQIRLISGAGPSPSGRDFDYAWKRLRELKADVVDEHYYAPPAWFTSNTHRYDNYDRNGPKVFAGEYAAQSVRTVSPDNRNKWLCALSEAAFLTGIERNSDVVVMSSYAPLFAHVERWQWRPDLIWFDNLRSFGTPDYYVQKLFSTNRAESVLGTTIEGAGDGLFAVAGRDAKGKQVILKIVNTEKAARAVRISLAGVEKVSAGAQAIVMACDDLAAENSLDDPTKVAPRTTTIDNAAKAFTHTLPGQSVTVLRIDAE